MGRIRSIKPELPLDDELAALGFAARYLFINLWCQCDKSGRCEDRPKKLQAQIFPWDKIEIEILLKELSPKFIIRYEVDGRKYIQVRTWEKHQRPLPNERESIIPAPTEEQQVYNKCMTSVKPLMLREGKGREGERKGKEGSGHVFIPPTIDEVKAFCSEQRNGVDAEAFLAHYTTVGWVYGQHRTPVKNWKSCVTTWKKKSNKMTVSDLTQ